MSTATATAATCRRHRRREARATCVSCLVPICMECAVTTRVGVKCRSCGGVELPRGRRRVASLLAGLAALGAAAGVATVLMLHGQGGAGSAGPARSGAPAVTAPALPPAGPVYSPPKCSLDHDMC